MDITASNFEKIKITPVGVNFDESITFEEWTSFGKYLQLIQQSLPWLIGDWLRYGERKWGEMYSQAIEETGLDYGTLANYKYVAENVDFSLRNEKVSWSIHKEVAKYEPDKQKEILTRCEKEGLHTKDVRQLSGVIETRINCRKVGGSVLIIIRTGENENGFEVPFNEFVIFLDKYKVS